MSFPQMLRVRQLFEDSCIADPRAVARAAAARLLASFAERAALRPILPGQSVAVGCGSRGIANLAEIVAGVIAALKEAGLEPFIVPAMGSHGGGTAERQLNVLRHYGVTEEHVGAPVRSSTETVELARTPEGIPILFDRLASEADHVFVINRVKPHSHFVGPVESGPAKMLLIGFGKPAGALQYHRAFARHSFPQVFQSAIPVLLKKLSVLGGLAIIENARDETARLVPLRGDELLEREPALLREAVRRMARLPFEEMDVLIVDRMGKDISGVGMDTNVIGRDRPDLARPRVQVIFVRDLTPASEGNASGIGLADVTVRRLIEKMDPKATFLNCATAMHLHLARVPYAFETDREALEAALGATAVRSPAEARIVWIRDTLALAELEASVAFTDEVARRSELVPLGEPHDILFHPDGALMDVFSPPVHGGVTSGTGHAPHPA